MKQIIMNWIAAAIARQERRAALVALRYMSDRHLKDIGIYRGSIDNAVYAANPSKKVLNDVDRTKAIYV